MTTHSAPRLRRIHLLLNTLVGERHVRAPLLHEVCDLLRAGDLLGLRSTALDLLAALDRGIDPSDFDERVRTLRSGLEGATGGGLVAGGR